jgi:tRNA nucleotidyltransferase (CCA-adding enzyme)
MKTFSIPPEVASVANQLTKAGFEAYLVGGCVRDLVLNRTPKDWDIATNATPEEIQKVFPDSFYENTFGTVGVVSRETTDETLKVVEVTPYRSERGYSDFRRPDIVAFEKELSKDLERRDFTINALAASVSRETLQVTEEDIIDPFKGLQDLTAGIIRAVGEPDKRFTEDGLRIIRAIRLMAELNFAIEAETLASIQKNNHILSHISKERIRDEFQKIVMSDQPMVALATAEKLGVLAYISPELREGIGIDQNQAHSFTVFEHLLRTLQHAADKKLPLHVRLAALFHDVGKPKTRNFLKDKGDWTFYHHEVIGAKMTKKALEGLKFSRETIEKVTKLVRWHMFFTDTQNITLSAVRRLIQNVGKDLIWDLMELRKCDRVGTGRPKETPYRLRKYHAMIEQVMTDPISVGMLAVDGREVIAATKLTPGPKIGLILHALLEEVLDDPTKNTKEYLLEKAIELAQIDEKILISLGQKGRIKKEEVADQQEEDIKKKYFVN